MTLTKARLSLLTASALILSTSAGALSPVTSVNISLEQVTEAPRWMFDPKAKIKGGPLIDLMVEAKKALLAKDGKRCLSAITKTYAVGKSLGPWLALNQLQCAILKDKKGVVSMDYLKSAVARVDAQSKWLLYGPSVPQLRTAYVNALLALVELQIKNDRRSAWKTIDRLQQIRPWLNTEERANLYKGAGELAFVEQNLMVAQNFLSRSLSEKENAELRIRIQSIRASLSGDKKTKTASSAIPTDLESLNLLGQTPAQKSPEDLGMSDEERAIYARLNRSYQSQDYLSAIEDGVELIQKFPGSRRALEASDRVLEIYLSVAARGDEKFRHMREAVVKTMGKADAGRLARWAANAYSRGDYQDALDFANKAYSKYAGHPDSTKVLLLAGKAAYAAGEYSDANDNFEMLLLKHGGTPEALEATYRLGLLQMRQKKYPQAAAFFERLMALSGSKDYEYRALYWQWRAEQKIDKDRAALVVQPLIAKYPLSYYGLRAKAEVQGGTLQMSTQPVEVRADFRFLETERLAWERLNVLLKAGWVKEAEKELETLPEAQNAEERVVRARLWASALRYDLAVQLLNKAMDEDHNLQNANIIKTVFPKEYSPFIKRESKNLNLDEDWILSLIRQESTFRPEAKSSSNALGLMQLLPATAGDLVKDLKVKDFQLPDSLYDPDVNIHLGSTYLSRMFKNFSGNVPLALAAYNAGPTRLRRWLQARKDLDGLENLQTSSPEVELWIDELPWDETSFYVKAILRNWLIYRLIEGSKLTLTDPIWLDARTSAR